jgi:hypothetical protein
VLCLRQFAVALFSNTAFGQAPVGRRKSWQEQHQRVCRWAELFHRRKRKMTAAYAGRVNNRGAAWAVAVDFQLNVTLRRSLAH